MASAVHCRDLPFMKCICSFGVTLFLLASPFLARADTANDSVTQMDNLWLRAESNPTANATAAEQTAFNKARLGILKDTATQAHDFAENNPGNPAARHAKKIEALATLSQAQLGDVGSEPRALRLGYVFRQDLQNDEGDRFEVAARMMEYSIGQKQLPASQLMGEYEKRADGLVAEFPKHAGVYNIYLGLMRISSVVDARRMATKVLVSPADSTVKDQAKDILAQLDLVGTRPEIEFTAVDGTQFQLKDQLGKIVVFYIWTSQSQEVAQVFTAVRQNTSGATLVGVNIDQDPAAAAGAAARSGAPGIQYSDTRGLKGPLPQQLKVQQVPSVYVFRADGTLAGFGAVSDLARLTASASR